MDPITLALVSALTAGLVTGVSKVGENIVNDAYNALKTALSRKFGKKSKVLKAVNSLEVEPGSKLAQAAVSDSLSNTKANQDHELLRLAGELSRSVINITQSAGNNSVQIGQANNMSGVVAQNIQGNVYTINQGPSAPTAQDLLMRGVGLVRAGSYNEAGSLLSQSLLSAPSGDANYYHALSMLRGRHPRVLTYSEAVSIRKKLEAACALDASKAHYWYLRALLEYAFFMENGFSDEVAEIEDLLETGDQCKYVRSFVAELLEHVPAPGNEVYDYLAGKP